MHRPTVDIYDEHGLEWAAAHERAVDATLAHEFAAAVPTGRLRIDLGCGAGRYLPDLGSPTLAVDASPVMLAACVSAVSGALAVRADVEHLPFRRGSISGAWSWMSHHHLPRTRLPLALWEVHRILAVGAPFALAVVEGDVDGPTHPGEPVGRHFSGWKAEELADLLEGGGFTVEPGSVESSAGDLRLRAVRARTLADTVAPGMRMLVCGVNPSPYSADSGIGYGRPGNRFWPAALAAGIVSRDRDPLHALVHHGMGMSDFVKRATRQAAEVGASEYRHGFDRLSRLVAWLQPGVVCFVGLSGWRSVADKKAVAGLQPERLAGRPVYLMPSTSGLNANSSLSQLADHLGAAWAVGGAS